MGGGWYRARERYRRAHFSFSHRCERVCCSAYMVIACFVARQLIDNTLYSCLFITRTLLTVTSFLNVMQHSSARTLTCVCLYKVYTRRSVHVGGEGIHTKIVGLLLKNYNRPAKPYACSIVRPSSSSIPLLNQKQFQSQWRWHHLLRALQ